MGRLCTNFGLILLNFSVGRFLILDINKVALELEHRWLHLRDLHGLDVVFSLKLGYMFLHQLELLRVKLHLKALSDHFRLGLRDVRLHLIDLVSLLA